MQFPRPKRRAQIASKPARVDSGCLSKIVGSLLTIFGFLACLTVIGAVIGVPMIVVGILFFFAGRWVWIALAALVIYIAVMQSQKGRPEATRPSSTVQPEITNSTPIPANSPNATAHYANSRFAYVFTYPAALFAPLPEAANADGRSFSPLRGSARLAVWGAPNALEQSPDDVANDQMANCLPGRDIYKMVKAESVVTSCVTPDGIKYARAMMRPHGQIITFEIKYPESERSIWDQEIAKFGLVATP